MLDLSKFGFGSDGNTVNERVILGSISPNFFAKQKVAGARRLAKNSFFNFTIDSVTENLNQNLANMCQIPFPPRYIEYYR